MYAYDIRALSDDQIYQHLVDVLGNFQSELESIPAEVSTEKLLWWMIHGLDVQTRSYCVSKLDNTFDPAHLWPTSSSIWGLMVFLDVQFV